MSYNTRRQFIQKLATASLTGLASPLLAQPGNSMPAWTHSKDEAYWTSIKAQFSVPENRVMMNAANLCPSPDVVRDKMIEFTNALNRDVSFQYRDVFTELRKKSLRMLSAFVGADEAEIGITRNTSESNGMIAHGLDLKAGDEVIIWEQNHYSNREVWLSQAKRLGFTVVKVVLPGNPKSRQELVEPFERAVTSKTKLIAFSHISNLSGLALPAKEICSMAKAKGIMTLVDGAQSLGMTSIDLHDMGCTFYSASTHKWMMGPFENGLLYIHKDSFNRIWPTIIGGGWHEAKTVDENLCVLGQRNETSPAALPEIINFHHTIGKKNIEERVVQLNIHLKAQLQQHVPQASFVTPLASEFSGGITIINLPGKEPGAVYTKLYTDYGIASAPSGGIRLSPHIYNTLNDIDYVVKAIKELAQ
jgi:selenocysteine lyase/cysteine desulfurase